MATARELAAAADANLADDPERSMLLALAAIDADEVQRRDGAARGRRRRCTARVTASRVVLSVPGVGGAAGLEPRRDHLRHRGPRGVRPGRHPRRRDRRRRCARSTATTSTSTTSPSAATVRCSPPPVTTAPFASGIPPPATSCSAFQDENGASGREVRVGGQSFSPDGSRLAAAWPDDVVRVIDVDTGEVVHEDRGCRARRALPSARTGGGS